MAARSNERRPQQMSLPPRTIRFARPAESSGLRGRLGDPLQLEQQIEPPFASGLLIFRSSGGWRGRAPAASALICDGSRFFFEDGRSDTELTLPLKRRRPVTISYNTAPKKMSLRRRALFFDLSGDMY